MSQTTDEVTINLKDAFIKRYACRRTGGKINPGRSVQAVFPFEVIEREARRHDVGIDDFIHAYELEYAYDGMGMYVRFVPKAGETDVSAAQ
ncbi:MAG: hypothetical protein ABIH46_11500 [Chloroflexota bacterium]